MTRRTRKMKNESSLDLFLDAICNAFGGIMFISILVSILVSMRSNQPQEVSKASSVSEAEASRLQEKLESLQLQIRTIAQSNADRERLLMTDGDTEVDGLRARHQELVERVEALHRQQALDLTSARKNDQSIKNAQTELQELSTELREARIAAADRSKDFEEALDATETMTQLPKVAETFKGNILLAMRYGKIYLLTDIQGKSTLGVNEEHATATGVLGRVLVKPIAGKGWSLAQAAGKVEVERLLKRYSTADTFFSIAVWPDSFKEFGDFKAILIREGFEYDLVPLDETESLSIGSASSATVQ